MSGDPLQDLVGLPGVADAVEAARTACEELRWHEAFRRRWREVRAESGLHAARASAQLDGARVPLDVLRAWATGTGAGPAAAGRGPDPADALAYGALRAQAVVERALPDLGGRAAGAPVALPQLLARLHTAAAADLLPAAAVGRPRDGEPQDLRGLGPAPSPEQAAARTGALVQVVAASAAPALVVAAVVHAELLVVRPFAAGNGVVARAAARWLLTARGLDPTGTVLAEPVWADVPAAYLAGAARFATGTPDGVAAWLVGYAEAVRSGAARARVVADAVLAGRLPAA